MRLPLYAKILLWFFLNLLVLAGAALVAFSFQFRLGPELLISGVAGERIQRITSIIRDEIHASPRVKWNEILQRFGSGSSVRFLLFRNDGTQVAGESTVLPPEVSQRITEGRGLPRRGPPPRDDGPPRDNPDFRPPPEIRERPPAGATPIRFVVRTREPKRYWIGTAMPIMEGPTVRGPGTLVLVSDSLRGGGLLVDFSLWIWVGAGAVIFSVLFWLPMVSSITRSLAQMNLATEQIAEGKFDVRLNEKRRDELGSLGVAINRMATRLAGFVTGQKRFTGDIAHELCSPIARMQMAVGILEERGDPKDRQYVDDLREEVQHMSSLVNELLSFSKASMGATNVRLQSVALRPLIEKAVKREARDGADIRVEIPDDCEAIIDPELIVRAVSNLLRNAIHYAGTAGPITVSARMQGNEIELVVADSGPGVPESELTKLFDPFYRVDVSRTRETGGVGLGLSIVKTCIETCHGTVICRNRQPSGLEVIMRLPR
jgi:two-component system sensor histidine kinase CpxA